MGEERRTARKNSCYAVAVVLWLLRLRATGGRSAGGGPATCAAAARWLLYFNAYHYRYADGRTGSGVGAWLAIKDASLRCSSHQSKGERCGSDLSFLICGAFLVPVHKWQR